VPTQQNPEHTVVLVVYDGVQTLDVTGPYEVFAAANALLDDCMSTAARYSLKVCAARRNNSTVTSDSGFPIAAGPLPQPSAAIDTVVIAGGSGALDARRDQRLVGWIGCAARRARRVATVCTGAFVAAEAGLLNGCTVTTHWARAQRLAAEYPEVLVDPDPIYLRSGALWTSAGVTAGIDMSLAMVEADHGADLAVSVARWLVMFMHRPGGQTQFATTVWKPRAEHRPVRAAQDYIDANPADDLRVDRIAARVGLSERHFTRVFRDEVGEPPAQYVERVRVEAARRQLETTNDTVDRVARECGLGSAESLRRAFHRRLGVPPDTYRNRFRRH
jgi:transcriptional regulator GlxA family with amidase domain